MCDRCRAEERQCLGFTGPPRPKIAEVMLNSSRGQQPMAPSSPSSSSYVTEEASMSHLPSRSPPATSLTENTTAWSPSATTTSPSSSVSGGVALAPMASTPVHHQTTHMHTQPSLDLGTSPHDATFDSIVASLMHPMPSDSELLDWMSAVMMEQTPVAAPAFPSSSASSSTRSNPSTTPQAAAAAAAVIPAANLQQRLKRVCNTESQLEAVSRFFNFVVQIFHLIPAEASLWRRVFGELCTDSPLVLDLVTAVGLVSLSISDVHGHNRRPAAYAYLSRALAAWQRIESQPSRSPLQSLEVIAGALLIGHVEQFDSGVAQHTNSCIARAMQEVLEVLYSVTSPTSPQPSSSQVDQGPDAPFRFLVRLLLWWDTLSRTMGPGSGYDTAPLFAAARRWDSDADEGCMALTQCVCSWPLDLLEAVARITRVVGGSIQHSDQGVSRGAGAAAVSAITRRSIENQIRACRPRSITEDSFATAENRYRIFEALQAGVMVYFCRIFELDGRHEAAKVVSFLTRRYTPREGSTLNDDDDGGRQRRQAERGTWQERAPDGALLWSYLQAVSSLVDGEQQRACRATLHKWADFGDCGAINLGVDVAEAIWKRQDASQATWDDVQREARWAQLLIF